MTVNFICNRVSREKVRKNCRLRFSIKLNLKLKGFLWALVGDFHSSRICLKSSFLIKAWFWEEHLKNFMITKYFFSLLLKNCLKFEHYFSIWLKNWVMMDVTLQLLHYIIYLHNSINLHYVLQSTLFTLYCTHIALHITLLTHIKLHITLNIFQLEIWESEWDSKHINRVYLSVSLRQLK